MKKIIIITIASLPLALFAQSIERQVIGATGSYTATGTIQASSTVGEAVVATGTSGAIVLTQGFQQPGGSGEVGIDEPELGFSMNAYPNPSADAIIIDFNVDKQLNIQIGLFNAEGRSYVLPESKLVVSGSMKHTVDLSAFAAGNYFIRITDDEGKLNSSIKIQKVD